MSSLQFIALVGNQKMLGKWLHVILVMNVFMKIIVV